MVTRAPNPQQDARLAYEPDVASALSAALTEATGGHVTAVREQPSESTGNPNTDLTLRLDVDDESVDIAVEVLRQAYPRDVREAMWRLDEVVSAMNRPRQLIPLVAAEALSPGAKDLLRQRGVAYFEHSGTLYLRWRQWLINIDRPTKARAKKASTTLFSKARDQVVHALLVHRGEWLTGNELSKLAQTSTYTCSKVLEELERREWCESHGAGPKRRRRLVEPGALLDAWAEQWPKRKESRSRWYVFPRTPDGLLTQLTYQIEQSGSSAPWAFTGTAAANVYAPLLTSVETAELIVPPGQTQPFAEMLSLKPAEKGANVMLVERDGAALLFRDRHPEYPAWFASPFIQYLDLLDGRGRNKELAQHVREKLEL